MILRVALTRMSDQQHGLCWVSMICVIHRDGQGALCDLRAPFTLVMQYVTPYHVMGAFFMLPLANHTMEAFPPHRLVCAVVK